MTGIATPDCLRVLDIVGSDADCELWIKLRTVNDVALSIPRTIEDIRNDHGTATRHGRATFVAACDVNFGAIIRTDAPAGVPYLYITLVTDGTPVPQLLHSVIDLALTQAVEDGATRLHTAVERERWTYDALVDTLGFRDAEQWLQFHHDVDGSESVELFDGLSVLRLDEHPEFHGDAFRLYHDGFDDMPGDLPRPDRNVEEWIAALETSRTSGLDYIALLVDADGTSVALTKVSRRAQGVPFGDIDMVSTARNQRGKGYARIARSIALPLAWGLGITRLDTFTRSDNAAIIHLCRTQGWIERERVHYLDRDL